MSKPDEFLTAAQVGKLVGRTPQTIHRWVEAGYIKPVTAPSGQIRFRRSVVDAFVATLEEQAS